MWIFDGEQWIDDRAPAEEKPSSGPSWQRPDPHMPDQCYPELQIVEIVPVTRREPVPPFPSVGKRERGH